MSDVTQDGKIAAQKGNRMSVHDELRAALVSTMCRRLYDCGMEYITVEDAQKIVDTFAAAHPGLVEVVRCGDCADGRIQRIRSGEVVVCSRTAYWQPLDWYCADGQRKGEDTTHQPQCWRPGKRRVHPDYVGLHAALPGHRAAEGAGMSDRTDDNTCSNCGKPWDAAHEKGIIGACGPYSSWLTNQSEPTRTDALTDYLASDDCRDEVKAAVYCLDPTTDCRPCPSFRECMDQGGDRVLAGLKALCEERAKDKERIRELEAENAKLRERAHVDCDEYVYLAVDGMCHKGGNGPLCPNEPRCHLIDEHKRARVAELEEENARLKETT